MLPRVTSVSYLDGYRLKLRFTNKQEGIIDFRQRIVRRGGVFKPLEELAFFKQVKVDKEAGTLVWPNEVGIVSACHESSYCPTKSRPDGTSVTISSGFTVK